MEDKQDTEFDPPKDEFDKTYIDDLDKSKLININNSIDDDWDVQEILSLFDSKKPVKYIKDKNTISNSIIIEKNFENIGYSNEKMLEKLKKFLYRAYKLICAHNEENEMIEKEKIEDNDYNENDKENEIKFINILEKLIENKSEFKKMGISVENGIYKFNENYFNIILEENHEINMCNDLLNMKIKINPEIIMSINSGNVQINFYKMEIDYNNAKQIIYLKPNLKCSIINNTFGKRSITYCTCGKCDLCENKNKEYKYPFDNLLNYLKEVNQIKENKKLTYLFFKGCNSYKNNSNYKCSFCEDFYVKKSNIVRLFCNKEIDPDHTCEFWICRDCYKKKFKYREKEICPNCEKFIVDFGNLKSYYKWTITKQ